MNVDWERLSKSLPSRKWTLVVFAPFTVVITVICLAVFGLSWGALALSSFISLLLLAQSTVASYYPGYYVSREAMYRVQRDELIEHLERLTTAVESMSVRPPPVVAVRAATARELLNTYNQPSRE